MILWDFFFKVLLTEFHIMSYCRVIFQDLYFGRKIGHKNDVISVTRGGDKEFSGGDAGLTAATR
jgi:hypothetical protein